MSRVVTLRRSRLPIATIPAFVREHQIWLLVSKSGEHMLCVYAVVIDVPSSILACALLVIE